jgi:hypothetical protein
MTEYLLPGEVSRAGTEKVDGFGDFSTVHLCQHFMHHLTKILLQPFAVGQRQPFRI